MSASLPPQSIEDRIKAVVERATDAIRKNDAEHAAMQQRLTKLEKRSVVVDHTLGQCQILANMNQNDIGDLADRWKHFLKQRR